MSDAAKPERGDKPRPRWKRWLRRGLKITAGLVALVIVAAVVAIALLHTDWGREKVRARVESALDGVFAGDVRVGKIEGSLLGDFAVVDLSIADRDGREAIGFDRLTIRYRLRSLFGKEIEIEDLIFDDLRVGARRTASGLNLASLIAPGDEKDDDDDDDGGGEPSAWRVVAHNIELRHSRATLDALDAEERVSDIELVAELGIAGGAVDIAIERLAGRWSSRDLPFAASAHVVLDQRGASVDRGSIAVGDASVTIDAVALSAGGAESFKLGFELPAAVAARAVPGVGLRADLSGALSGERAATDRPMHVKLALRAGHAAIDGAASIDLAASRATASLTIAAVDLEAIWEGLPDSDIGATVEVEASGASLAELSGRATIRGAGRVHRSSIRDLAMTATIAGQQAAIELTGSPDGGALVIRGGYDLERQIIAPTRVTLSHRRAEELLAPFADVGGSIAVDVTASGPIDSVAVTGSVRGSPSAYGNSARDLEIDFDLRRSGDLAAGTATVKSPRVVAGGTAVGAVKASLELHPDRTIEFDAGARGPADSHRVELAGVVALLDGGVAVDLGDSLIAVRGLRWTGRGGRIERSDAGVLEVERLELSSPAGVIAVDGTFGLSGGLSSGAAKIAARDLELADFGRALGLAEPLRGRATITAELDVSRRHNRGDIKVALDRVAYGDRLAPASGSVTGRLVGRGLLATADLEIDGLGTVALESSARGPRSAVDVGGWTRLGTRDLEHARLTVSIADLARLPRLSDQMPTGGSLTLTATAGDRAADLVVNASVTDLTHPRLAEPATVAVEARAAANRVDVSGVAMILRRAHVRFSGAADIAGPPADPSSWGGFGPSSVREVSAIAHGLDVDHWLRELRITSDPLGARAMVRAELSPRDGTGHLFASVTQAKGGPRSNAYATETTADVTLDSGGVRATIAAYLDRTRYIDGRASLAISAADLLSAPSAITVARLDARFAIDDMPLAAVRDAVTVIDLSKQKPLSGDLSLVATASGSLEAIKAGVDVDLDGSVVRGIKFKTLRLTGRYDAGPITATLTGVQRGGGRIAARFATDVSKPGAALSADLDMRRFGLAFANEIVPERALDGALSANLALRGTRARPRLTGTAHLMKGEVRPGSPLFSLRELDIKARLTETALTLKGTGVSGRGTLDLDTRVGLRELAPTDLKVVLATDKMPMEAGPFIIGLDTKTTVDGRRTGDDWSLRTRVAETVVHLPGERSHSTHPTGVPDDLVFVDAAAAEKTAPFKAPRPSSRVFIAVRAPDSIEVRGPQANAVAGARLDITASDTARIIGQLQTQRGWIDLFGRRYEIRRAQIIFDNSTEPTLNIQLAYEFSNMTLIIDVGGTGSEPRVKLRADPARYSDSELLSFVLGASPDDPRSGTETADSRATGIASSLLANQMQSLVSDVVPIDVLRIDMADDQAAAEKLTVGKWLTRNLFVAYRQRFAPTPDENGREGTLEYRFWRSWFLEVFYGDEQVGGADVLWIKRF